MGLVVDLALENSLNMHFLYHMFMTQPLDKEKNEDDGITIGILLLTLQTSLTYGINRMIKNPSSYFCLNHYHVTTCFYVSLKKII